MVKICCCNMVITVKNHENWKNHTFWQKSKSGHKLVNFFCICMVNIVFKMQMYLVFLLFNGNCVYWKTRPILSSKVRPMNYKILIYIFRLIIEVEWLIKKVIANLDSSKASSPDCIPVVLLKNCEPKLSYILAEHFSMCLKESCFPNCLKGS